MLVECRLQGASHVITHLCGIFNIRANYRAKEFVYNFAALVCEGSENFWNIRTRDDNFNIGGVDGWMPNATSMLITESNKQPAFLKGPFRISRHATVMDTYMYISR